MDFSKFVIVEAETKNIASKFDSLCKTIQGAIENCDKFLADENVIETNNINTQQSLEILNLIGQTVYTNIINLSSI